MQVTFRCKASGNTVKFMNQVDIDSMRKESDYEELKSDGVVVVREAVQEGKESAPQMKVTVAKKRGRPAKK